MDVGMYGWCREKRDARDMHIDQVWLAQTPIGMVCGHVWLVQRSRDMHVENGWFGAESGKKGMLTWLLVQKPHKCRWEWMVCAERQRSACGECVVGAEAQETCIWKLVVGAYTHRHGCGHVWLV